MVNFELQKAKKKIRQAIDGKYAQKTVATVAAAVGTRHVAIDGNLASATLPDGSSGAVEVINAGRLASARYELRTGGTVSVVSGGGGSGGGSGISFSEADTRYYTKSQLDIGQLDIRYYTETESDARFLPLTGSAQYQIPVTGSTPFTATYTALSSFAGSGLAFSSGFNIGQGDGIAVNANDIAVRRYVDSGLAFGLDGGLTLGTPIAVSINTTSVVTGVQHGHAVISSSNPGAAASLLATSASGTLTLNNAGSTSTPALVIGDGSTGRLAIGSSGWRDNATQLEMLGSRTLYVGSNPVGGAAWSIDAAGQVSAAAGDGSAAHVFGLGTIGLIGSYTSFFGFAATAFANTSDYALLQSSSNGATFINAPSGQSIYNRIANVDVMAVTASRLNPAGSILKDLGDYNRKWRTLYAAELYVETLVAQDVISTIGGRIMVAPTTTLIADLTNVATTIDVKHNNLVSGDYVYMASAPGGVAQVESMKVTSAATTITGGYRYTVTRNQDGSGANSWVAGDAVADIGGAVGSGYIDLTASSTLHGHLGPTMTIYSRTSTATWNGVKPTVSVGNLRSFVDYSSDIFGIAHGNDLTLTPTSGFSGITSDNTNGLRLFNTSLNLYTGGNQFLKLDTTTGFTIKSGTGTSLPTSSIYGAMWYRDTLGGNKAAYIASVYDTTNPTLASRGNNLFITSYDSPAGPSQLNIIAIDESNAFVDMAQIAMSGGKPTLSMTSNIAMQAKTVTLTTGAKSLVLDQTKAAFNQNIEIGTTLTAGTADTALTSTVQDAILLRHNSALTPANGLGVGVFAKLESSTTANQSAGRLAWKWATVADATRASRLDLSTYYTTTERIGLSLGSNSTVPLIGFLGTSPVARPAAFTQTYATASRTHSNITAVNPAAYAAGANGYSTAAMAAAVHAAVIAHTADIANVKQVVNQLIDDLQAYGLSG